MLPTRFLAVESHSQTHIDHILQFLVFADHPLLVLFVWFAFVVGSSHYQSSVLVTTLDTIWQPDMGLKRNCASPLLYSPGHVHLFLMLILQTFTFV